MAANTNALSLRSVLEKDKLNGLNFLDWFRNLRIVLKQEQKLYVIEKPLPNEPPANASRAGKDAYKKHLDEMVDVGCLMLATMNLELQKQHEDMVSYDMIEHLKELYQGKQGKQGKRGSISLRPYSNDSYSQFVLNFNMNEIDKTLPQLLSMLRTAEGNMKKVGPKPILMVRNNKGKRKAKVPTKPKGKGKPNLGKGKATLKPKGGVSKEGNCFHFGVTGHWKRNCPVYLEEIKKAKASRTSASGIYVIDINLSTTAYWVLDTGCGSHICTSVQGLQRSRTLARGDVDLRVGNGARVAALAVGTYTLSLPSGLGKMTKSPFTGKSERASDLLGLIYSDVCRPINTQARGGFHYFITFTDDFSRYGYVYLMRHKSEALEKFKEFKNKVQNQLGKTIKTLRSDQGGEYLSLEFDDLLKECEIVSQLTPPGTPQWHGVSKRRNRTLLDMVRSMMRHVDLPISFWGHTLETAIFTLNRVPSNRFKRRHMRCGLGNVPVCLLWKFGVAKLMLNVRRLLSLNPNLKGVSLWETQPPRRSLRERHAPERYGFLITTHGDILLIDQNEPRTYQEAVASPDSEKWLEAMRSEMDSMYENQVWTLVDPPEGVKPIGCKWVFKKKTDMDSNVQTYKGRLVSKGFRQIHGVDYDETFSPVAMFKSIRILLAIAAFHDYEI
ncbi:hypothetical protein CXB51_028118 [Gossypium anomalum]|uniref:Integrase catalytic domain-containing protein n=1 Tax=Gossypium anomalum TaxID=47600 RepID=A0A8J6CQ25_9ROSI|nr:hypothetical protein CXB51_028118 [Gossypium anomalum]